jgi:hypothetical protein
VEAISIKYVIWVKLGFYELPSNMLVSFCSTDASMLAYTGVIPCDISQGSRLIPDILFVGNFHVETGMGTETPSRRRDMNKNTIIL